MKNIIAPSKLHWIKANAVSKVEAYTETQCLSQIWGVCLQVLFLPLLLPLLSGTCGHIRAPGGAPQVSEALLMSSFRSSSVPRTGPSLPAE